MLISLFAFSQTKEELKKQKEKIEQEISYTSQLIKEIKKDGNHTYQEIANQLNKRGIPTARGGIWHATSVRNIIKG